MNYKFLIKHNEQEFKDQYFKYKKDDYIALFNYSYYLIDENSNTYMNYLLFSLERNRTKAYNNILYRISNKFGDFIYKENNYKDCDRYFMYIKDNYYMYYYFANQYDERHNEIMCRVIYMDDNILSYDNDNLDWVTLTPKKLEGLVPIEAKYEINKKLPIFMNVINSKSILRKI